jgi:hypothetical protein
MALYDRLRLVAAKHWPGNPSLEEFDRQCARGLITVPDVLNMMSYLAHDMVHGSVIKFVFKDHIKQVEEKSKVMKNMNQLRFIMKLARPEDDKQREYLESLDKELKKHGS